MIVSLFREASPLLRQVSSTIRWAETILQLNSLFNPLLYWYRTKRLRKHTLDMLRCRKTATKQSTSPTRQCCASVTSLDVEKFQSEQKRPRIFEAVMCSDTFGQRLSKAVKETPTSVAKDEKFTQQRNQLIATVHIENAPGGERQSGQQKNTTDLGGSWRHIGFKIVRSNSRNENSFASITNRHHITTQRNAQRSMSVPIILTNLTRTETQNNCIFEPLYNVTRERNYSI